LKKRGRLGKILRSTLISISLLLVLLYVYLIFPFWGVPFNASRHGNPPLTPAWALECWLWEDDINTADRVDELLKGYEQHDIPVRTILLDSPWSLRYNDFAVDTLRYPEPEKWFEKLEDSDYRVVLWMTTMVNSHSKDTEVEESEPWYSEAKEKGFLLPEKEQVEWWKGRGGFIDYYNPEALKWWHGMQQQAFDLGVDGWKLDGTATLLRKRTGVLPLFYIKSDKGIITTRGYMDHYYRDEYAHGLKQQSDFITLARSMDRGFHPEGFAPIDAAPVTWVGDQEHVWDEKGAQGFESAIESIMKSAKKGYHVTGSDVAGFSGAAIPPRLYIRWAQFSSFCGLFLNGGHGERGLWERSQQELEIIREFSWLHTELVPYMYSHVAEAHQGGDVLQRPIRGKHQYMFGDNLLIAPIYKDELTRKIHLPKGEWRYWFNDQEVIQGGVTFEKEFPLEEFPVYIREGAIIPMHIKRSYTNIGDKYSEGYLTFRIFPDGNQSFKLYDPHGEKKTVISVEETGGTIRIILKGMKRPHILHIQMESQPQQVELDHQILSPSRDYHYYAEKKKLILKTNEYSLGEYTILR